MVADPGSAMSRRLAAGARNNADSAYCKMHLSFRGNRRGWEVKENVHLWTKPAFAVSLRENHSPAHVRLAQRASTYVIVAGNHPLTPERQEEEKAETDKGRPRRGARLEATN